VIPVIVPGFFAQSNSVNAGKSKRKGPTRSHRVFFIGGIEEAFLVVLRLVWRSVRKPEVLATRVVATRKAQLLIYQKILKWGQ